LVKPLKEKRMQIGNGSGAGVTKKTVKKDHRSWVGMLTEKEKKMAKIKCP